MSRRWYTCARWMGALLALMASLAILAQDADVVITRDAPPDPMSFTLAAVATDLRKPNQALHAGDGSGRLFVVEQFGKVWIMRDGALDRTPFLDASALSRPLSMEGIAEEGLLGLAFHPDHANNGVFFISYTDHDIATVVARYQTAPGQPNIADPDSAQIILQVPQPITHHNVGHLEFGPDGYLYIGLGDGGGAWDPMNSGQNRQTLLGAILRIDVDSGLPYTIPPDNPFVNDPDALDEIWAHGLRNPWRFSFDRATGDLYIPDPGQNDWEEVSFQPADSRGGENYGWGFYEGNMPLTGRGSEPPDDLVPPLLTYNHSFGCAVVGGVVYRGSEISDLQGVYLYGDFCTGRIGGAWRDSAMAWQTAELKNTDMRISSFGEDEAGEIYVIDYDGTLYRFEAAG